MSEITINNYEAMFLFPQSATANLSEASDHVLAQLEKVGAEVISFRKWDDRRLAFPQAHPPPVGGPGHGPGGFLGHKLSRLAPQEVEHRKPPVGYHHLQDGSGSPGDAQEPGNRLAARTGDGQHRLLG